MQLFVSNTLRIFSMLFAIVGISSVSLAQSVDPVDRNHPGPFAGVQAQFGLASQVSGSGSGPAWGLGADVGYVMKRDTWNRLELGLGIETGAMDFKSSDADISMSYLPLVALKAGYGYSLGDHVFGNWRLAVGMASVSIEQSPATQGGLSFDTDGQAIVSTLGWDVVLSPDEGSELVFGAQFRIYNVNPDRVTVGSVLVDPDPFQVNVPSIYASFRLRI